MGFNYGRTKGRTMCLDQILLLTTFELQANSFRHYHRRNQNNYKLQNKYDIDRANK